MKFFWDIMADKRENTDDKKVESEMLGHRLRMAHYVGLFWKFSLAVSRSPPVTEAA